MTQTVILRGPMQRALAKQMVDRCPPDAVVTFSEAKRTPAQNSKMQAMLSDVARARPQGRRHPPEIWKALFMKACGYKVTFIEGLDGEPFPIGYRSSRLSKSEMSDLIECIYAYGSEHGVQWNEPPERGVA